MSGIPTQSRISFGLFEADPNSGELFKAGFRVRLQSQPFRVLLALLERPGEVVTREELQLRLWGKGTTVDFDHSLGTAINKIREALGDTPDNPRFVETLSRRGYRFIAPVLVAGSETASAAVVLSSPASAQDMSADPLAPSASATSEALGAQEMFGATELAPPTPEAAFANISFAGRLPLTRSRRSSPPRKLVLWIATGLALLLTLGLGILLGRHGVTAEVMPLRQLTHGGRILPAATAMESFPATVTDGVHLFSSAIQDGRPVLVQATVIGGAVQTLPIPDEVAGPAVGDISPDGSRLLLRSHLSNESEQPLWIAPTGGGSAQRIPNILAHDATWMPNGEDVLFAAGNELYTMRSLTAEVQSVAKLPGRAFWLRWSPDGKLLRFTVFDPLSHRQSLWELSAGSRQPKPLFSHWAEHADECCGVWTDGGSAFLFQSVRGNESDLWRVTSSRFSSPQRLTNGPLLFQSPVAARDGSRVFFTGVDSRSEVERYRPSSREFRPVEGFLSNATRLEFSRDERYVAWTDVGGRLWRAKADGAEKIQLVPDAIESFLVRWSPDGSRLAVMGRERGHAWQIYVVKADGGSLERVPLDVPGQHMRNAGDPTWSPDGRSLAFGRVPDLMGKENASRTIQTIDLATHTLYTLPGSEGFFSPRWSPDGRSIVALSFDQRQIVLFDVATEHWRTLATGSFADPVWSTDSRALYAQRFMDLRQPLVRIALPTGQMDEVASLANFPAGDVVDDVLCGLMPDNTPVVRARRATGDLYSLGLGNR